MLLVTEDHATLRAFLVGALTEGRPDLRVLQAGTIEEASNVLATHHIVVCIADVHVQGKNLLNHIPALKARALNPLCRFLAISTAPSPGLENQALQNGASAFVDKASGVKHITDQALKLHALSHP